MKLGVVAFEHPPAFGGMERLAAMHIRHLSVRCEVVVFTRDPAGESTVPGVRYEHGLTGAARADLPRLDAESVDGWLIFNGGLASYVPLLSAPAIVMVHGNDILRPWLPELSAPDVLLGRMMRKLRGEAARQAHLVRARQASIAQGVSRAAGVVAVSRFTRGLCARLTGRDAVDIAVIPPALEDSWFERPLPAQDKKPGLDLLTVARLTSFNRRKNIDGVLAAIAAIGDDLDIRYTVVGDGDDRQRLVELSQRLGLAARVTFTGAVSSEALAQAYATADLFVLAVKPVEDDVEGFGMVFTEAAAIGVPSLATRSGGIEDAVEDGVSGVLAGDASVEAIAGALRRFAAQRDAFDPARVRGFAEQFRIGKVGPRLEDALERAFTS